MYRRRGRILFIDAESLPCASTLKYSALNFRLDRDTFQVKYPGYRLYRDALQVKHPGYRLYSDAFQIKNLGYHLQLVQVVPGGDDVMVRNQVIDQLFAIGHAQYRAVQAIRVLELGVLG